MPEETTLYQSKWLGLFKSGHWEYVRRPGSDHCVGILAITDSKEVILIEQFRVPVGKNVIEIPAGLIGDEDEFAGEKFSQTAARELEEETGYRPGKIELLISSPTSAGMTPETTHLYLAGDLEKVSQGGGTGSEEITTHLIPLKDLRIFLSEKQSQGLSVDFKIHAALAAAAITF